MPITQCLFIRGGDRAGTEKVGQKDRPLVGNEEQNSKCTPAAVRSSLASTHRVYALNPADTRSEVVAGFIFILANILDNAVVNLLVSAELYSSFCGPERSVGQPKKILILFAHPRLTASIVQRAMLDVVTGLNNVTVHDLYAHYPDMMIDVDREQELLLAHDVIVMQHPFYWYSTPAILKEWQDLVLANGWAYGSAGTMLNGKFLMNAISTGGSQDAYRPDGRNRFDIVDLLRPFDQTAYLCGMGWLEPQVIYSGRQMEAGQLSGHAEKYRDIITGLRDGRVNPLKHIAPGHELAERFLLAQKAAKAKAGKDMMSQEAAHAS